MKKRKNQIREGLVCEKISFLHELYKIIREGGDPAGVGRFNEEMLQLFNELKPYTDKIVGTFASVYDQMVDADDARQLCYLAYFMCSLAGCTDFVSIKSK